MGKTLNEIAKQLKSNNKTVQLIYAFNGTGKTRLSKEFKSLVNPKNDEENEGSLKNKKIIYYNAFTEDLFYWDNDLANDRELKLKIHPNAFTKWILEEQGRENEVIKNFQYYTNDKLNPHFNENFTEIVFSYERGNDENSDNIKISKGEESCFIWSIFYSFLSQAIEVLNISEKDERETNNFDNLEYVFIDDPVSSLDENHLIELAVNLAQLVKSSKSELKFIITTHNPLFYNVLYNEFKNNKFEKNFLKKNESWEYEIIKQSNDSPFSYHIFLVNEIEKAIKENQLKKYHFNFLRNILEKTATFLGYENWGELLPKTENEKKNPYESRIINFSSHSKYSAEEIKELSDNDKRVISYLIKHIKETYRFKSNIL